MESFWILLFRKMYLKHKEMYVDRAFDAMKLTTREFYRHILKIRTQTNTHIHMFILSNGHSKNKSFL